jgi:type I restriction enzyme, S subunit
LKRCRHRCARLPRGRDEPTRRVLATGGQAGSCGGRDGTNGSYIEWAKGKDAARHEDARFIGWAKSWLGMVPKHWEVKRLKQLIREGTSISYGVVQPGPDQAIGIPFVQTTDLVKGRIVVGDLQKTTEEIASQYPRSRLEAGDILLGIRASVGDTCVAGPELEGVNLSRGIARIVPNSLVTAEFLCLCLQADYVAMYWKLTQQGSTFREVSIDSVKELPLAIPPVAIQDDILLLATNKLHRLDRAKNSVEHATTLLLEYRAALITNAVTGKIDVRTHATAEAAA